MLHRVYEDSDGIAAIELNLACPNIPGKPTISNDFDQMEQVLQAVTGMPQHGTIPMGIKIAPYFDMPFFERAATIIAKYPIQFVVCVNSLGNALCVDAENECEAIAPRRGLGGLGGGFIKHTALANVRTLSELLTSQGRTDIDIVGVGGVHSGQDAFEMILCGARAVQVGTCHWTEGAGCFTRIAAELEEIMHKKGYSSIDAFRGKLKPYCKATTRVPAHESTHEPDCFSTEPEYIKAALGIPPKATWREVVGKQLGDPNAASWVTFLSGLIVGCCISYQILQRSVSH